MESPETLIQNFFIEYGDDVSATKQQPDHDSDTRRAFWQIMVIVSLNPIRFLFVNLSSHTHSTQLSSHHQEY